MAIVLKRFVDSSYRNTDERHAQYANCPSHLVEFSGPFGNSSVNFSMISGCTNKKKQIGLLIATTLSLKLCHSVDFIV